jgi:hypothetical protein
MGHVKSGFDNLKLNIRNPRWTKVERRVQFNSSVRRVKFLIRTLDYEVDRVFLLGRTNKNHHVDFG